MGRVLCCLRLSWEQTIILWWCCVDFVNTLSVEYFGVLFKSLRWHHTEESKKEPSACAAAWARIVMHRKWARRCLGKQDSDPQETVNLTRKQGNISNYLLHRDRLSIHLQGAAFHWASTKECPSFLQQGETHAWWGKKDYLCVCDVWLKMV